ncbi:hypothetical protein D3C73_1027400 [compost metagenome]
MSVMFYSPSLVMCIYINAHKLVILHHVKITCKHLINNYFIKKQSVMKFLAHVSIGRSK